jgi:hypothetical protein
MARGRGEIGVRDDVIAGKRPAGFLASRAPPQTQRPHKEGVDSHRTADGSCACIYAPYYPTPPREPPHHTRSQPAPAPTLGAAPGSRPGPEVLALGAGRCPDDLHAARSSPPQRLSGTGIGVRSEQNTRISLLQAKGWVQATASLRTLMARPILAGQRPRSLSDAPVTMLAFRRSHTGTRRSPRAADPGPPS